MSELAIDRLDASKADTEGPASTEGTGFERVYVREFERLKRITAGMGFRRADAEDILQDVYLETLRRPGHYRDADSAFGWLARVTVNRCLLEHRRRKQRSDVNETLRQSRTRVNNEHTAAPDEDADRTEQVNLIRICLDEMEGSVRMVLVLRYFCDLNATQIGEILEQPRGTIRSRLRDARLVLAKRLKRKGIEP